MLDEEAEHDRIMLGTRIYRKDKMRKIALLAFIIVAVYALLFRPTKTMKELSTYPCNSEW